MQTEFLPWSFSKVFITLSSSISISFSNSSSLLELDSCLCCFNTPSSSSSSPELDQCEIQRKWFAKYCKLTLYLLRPPSKPGKIGFTNCALQIYQLVWLANFQQLLMHPFKLVELAASLISSLLHPCCQGYSRPNCYTLSKIPPPPPPPQK